ncbi:MAG: CAP domain-containing protein [Patescibacteria group bacterium]
MTAKRIGTYRSGAIFAVLLLCFAYGFITAPKQTVLAPLPVPHQISQTALSGPLTLSTVGDSVLGAQAIDPIDFVNEINIVRAKANAPALRLNATLMRAAKMRAEVMKKHQNFSHQDPYEGIELGTVLPKLHYSFIYATENIGMGGISASNFVEGFMNSTSHRNNLLDPTLTDTGAAIVEGPFKQYYVNYAVQLFAIPGGTAEYLGYKDTEKQLYEAEFAAVNANLHPLIWFIQRLKKNPRYTDAYYKKLKRQQIILGSILTRMRETQPLNNQDVALILEYNTLL